MVRNTIIKHRADYRENMETVETEATESFETRCSTLSCLPGSGEAM